MLFGKLTRASLLSEEMLRKLILSCILVVHITNILRCEVSMSILM